VAPLLWSVRVPTWLAIFWRKHLARDRIARRGAADPRSIIVFRIDQLGDLVLTTPLFRELKRHYPKAHCTVVVRAEYKVLLTTNRYVDEILPLAELRLRWFPSRLLWLASALWFCWTRLRHRHFDLAISPRWDVDENLSTMLCVLAGAGKRVGYGAGTSAAKQKLNRGFDAAFDGVVPPGTLQHELDRNLAVAEALGAKVTDRRLEIFLTDNDRKFARELFAHHDPRRLLVAIGIGGRAASRKWPLQRYAECIARLNQMTVVQPVIVCSEKEDADASALSLMLAVPPYILSGVPLRAVCAVLGQCDLFLGNDTGTAHLAAAVNCPTVVISRHPANGDPGHANSPVRFAPRCACNHVVQPQSGVGDCMDSCHSKEAHCILQVTVERVVAASLQLLPADFSARAGLPDLASRRNSAPCFSEELQLAQLVALS
jgi:ADP-heptose:LPS heptosyltransferase